MEISRRFFPKEHTFISRKPCWVISYLVFYCFVALYQRGNSPSLLIGTGSEKPACTMKSSHSDGVYKFPSMLDPNNHSAPRSQKSSRRPSSTTVSFTTNTPPGTSAWLSFFKILTTTSGDQKCRKSPIQIRSYWLFPKSVV